MFTVLRVQPPLPSGSSAPSALWLSKLTGQLLGTVITLHLSTDRCDAVRSPRPSLHNNSWRSSSRSAPSVFCASSNIISTQILQKLLSLCLNSLWLPRLLWMIVFPRDPWIYTQSKCWGSMCFIRFGAHGRQTTVKHSLTPMDNLE